MNETFYKLYKSLRDMVADFHDKDLSQPSIDFIESMKSICERQDRADPEYLNRWQNERFLLFRFHRGVLNESMETVVIVDSSEHLLIHISDACDIPFTKLTVTPYIFDHRSQWNTCLVCVYLGDISYPIGYLNKNPYWSIKDYE